MEKQLKNGDVSTGTKEETSVEMRQVGTKKAENRTEEHSNNVEKERDD